MKWALVQNQHGSIEMILFDCKQIIIDDLITIFTVPWINGDKRVAWHRIDEKIDSKAEEKRKNHGRKCE